MLPPIGIPRSRRRNFQQHPSLAVLPVFEKRLPRDVSADEIALRAYYIAEHRRNLSLPGDELGDWVEAERQLRKEAARKSS